MKARIVLPLLALLLFSLACDSNGGAGPSLNVDPPTVTVTAGGAAVPFTATLMGSSSAIAWTLSGPGTISATSGTTTSYTPPASVNSTATATLTATAAGVSAHATININAPTSIITVVGTVLDTNGLPVASAPVAIGTQRTSTDASGQFTISGVTTPYDLVTVVSAVNSTQQVGVEYQGLTRPDPTIVPTAFVTATPSLPNHGNISGNLSGGDPLNTARDFTIIAFGSPEVRETTHFVFANPFALSLDWAGPTSTTGTLHALQFASSGTELSCTSYKGYGTKTGVTVTNGSTASSQDITLASVSTANLSGSVTVPASYTAESRTVALAFSDGASLPCVLEFDPAAAFDYLMPSGIDATGSLYEQAQPTSWHMPPIVPPVSFVRAALAPDATGVSLELHTAAVQVLPANASTGITTNTDFTWTAFAGGLHIVHFVPLSTTNPEYYVLTSGTTTKIPDLAAAGLGSPLPTGAAGYDWDVSAQAPLSIDAVTSGSTNLPNPLYGSNTDRYYFTTL